MQEGQDLAAQGRFAEAEVPLKQAAELAPENYALLTLLGKVEGRVGKHADAIALFRRVVSGQPKTADAHVNLAIALADAGRPRRSAERNIHCSIAFSKTGFGACEPGTTTCGSSPCQTKQKKSFPSPTSWPLTIRSVSITGASWKKIAAI